MNRIISYFISEQESGLSILNYLKSLGYPHSVIVRLKKTHNGILRNGTWAYVNDILHYGDKITVQISEEAKHSTIAPIEHKLSIIHEDEDIIIIDKPSNMPVHPSMNNHENTLANALTYYYKQKGQDFTFRCINRLDRDTSGLTLVAKHLLSAGILNRDTMNHSIQKSYVAICNGRIHTNGVVSAPISRVDDSTIMRCVDPIKGEMAITQYNLIMYDSNRDLSFIQLHLQTGRTHQIRVHMKYIGHPLIGDFLYNPDYQYIQRQALHCQSLSFTHPITKEKMHFTSSLPADMKCIFPSF